MWTADLVTCVDGEAVCTTEAEALERARRASTEMMHEFVIWP